MAKAKVGARVVRGFFQGNTIGLIAFVVFLVTGVILRDLGSTSIPPVDWGLAGWVAVISGAIGSELSKDMEEE